MTKEMTGALRPVRTPETGRILSSEEAAFLQKYLLGSKPLIIMGGDNPYGRPPRPILKDGCSLGR